MAQETAGTIGIPVLKNEILPYLTDYAKRRERAELYKQKAEQRAAELAAKKAEEANKYVPPALPTAKGGYWNSFINDQLKTDVEEATAQMQAAKTPAEKGAIAQNVTRKYDALNYTGEQETARQRENMKLLRESGYNADENTISQYYAEAKADPNFATKNHVQGFEEWMRKNPKAFVSPGAIGTTLMNLSGTSDYKYQEKGKDKEFKYNNLFVIEEEKNPALGINTLKADKVNVDVAYKLLQGHPKMLAAADAFINDKALDLINASKNPLTGQPTMSAEDAHKSAAEEFFGQAVSKGRSSTTYKAAAIKKARGRSGGRDASAGTEPSPAGNFDVVQMVYDEAGNPIREEKFTLGDSSDVEYPMGTTNHPSGLKAIPLDAVTEDAELLVQDVNGLYKLKRSFTYDNPRGRIVNRAAKDIKIKRGPFGIFDYTIKKGSIIKNELASQLESLGRGDDAYKQKGYEITARTKSPATDEEKEYRFFVPEEHANTIASNIKKFREGKEEGNSIVTGKQIGRAHV